MVRNNQKKQKQKLRKRRQQKSKERKQNARTSTVVVPEPSAKIARKLNDIYEWIESDKVDCAFEHLDALVNSAPRSAAVAEAELGIYQYLDEHEQASHAAKRFLKLVPKNPMAMFGYAQASLLCSRVCIAVVRFREFLDRWPNHELAASAQKAIEVCESESRQRVRVANEKGFLRLEFDEGGMEFFARHEESLEQMAAGNMAEAISLIEQNLECEPLFLSSRNNLVTCRFYEGDLEDAIQTARETCRLAPENRFAEANLIKIEFLTGNPEKAHELADSMIADPPTEQDAYLAMLEALSFLGRDEDIVVLSGSLQQVTPIDVDKKGSALHYFAVAHYRMEDQAEALRLWKQCLKLFPDHPFALENVDELELGTGHTAWSEPVNKWLPRASMLRIVEKYKDSNSSATGLLVSENPVVATLVPALLDRGDPTAREFAFNFACTDATPPMLQALKDFAFSTRGPDSLRHKALTTLKEESLIDAGPHRFYSRGNWIQVELFAAEITHEPFEVEPWKSELLEEAYWAMQDGELDTAEELFVRVLERDPDCKSARFNLAGVWQRRGQRDEVQRAEAEIRQLHADHPDYSFASLSLAIMEAEDGNFEQAKKLTGTIVKKSKLHYSEAMMLFTTQVQVALAEDDLDAAESALGAMTQIAEEDDSRVLHLRSMIDQRRLASTKSSGLLRSC